MINGVSLSQLPAVRNTHLAHFRRLQAILTQPPALQQDPEMAQVVRNRRHNHLQWKRFKQGRQAEELQRENDAYRKKLQRIRMGTSIYRTKREKFNNSVAHNFYNRKKLELKIEVENPEIARRLIEMQSSISTTKVQREYSVMQKILHRLEKFPVVERLSSFSQKGRTKTEGDAFSPPSQLTPPSAVRDFSVPRRPPRTHF